MSCQCISQLKENYNLNPNDIENESPERKAVREFAQNHGMSIFGRQQADHILNAVVDGFILFNLRKDKYMLNSKEELLQYCKDENVTLQEKLYFWNIFLYDQRPQFLTYDEHEYIRACGDLDGYTPPTPPRYIGLVNSSFISDELAIFLGKPIGTEMSRVEVSKELNTYIRENGLQDTENNRIINADEKLRKLLGLTNEDELTYFNLHKYLKHHFIIKN
jgi:hypothetical protein